MVGAEAPRFYFCSVNDERGRRYSRPQHSDVTPLSWPYGTDRTARKVHLLLVASPMIAARLRAELSTVTIRVLNELWCRILTEI